LTNVANDNGLHSSKTRETNSSHKMQSEMQRQRMSQNAMKINSSICINF